ncbi:Bro-N domain-containing protein [Pseudomonas tohonis]|nr:Bro-N domain-containing protein [Pseudomonas tohonis]
MGNTTPNGKERNVQARTGEVIPFSFEKKQVRTLLVDDQPWFVAVDVATALQYSEASAMTRHLDDDEKGLSIVQTLGGDQEMLVLNESGLYSAILRSRKDEAKRFKKWVTAEVLPAIRKHGRYEDQGKMQTLLGETIGTDAVHALSNLVKGKVCMLPVALRRQATAKIWSQTHAAFGVRSAADIPAAQLDSVRNFIAAYALEGEWLPRDGRKEPSSTDWSNIAGLIHCVHAVYEIMEESKLSAHLSGLGCKTGMLIMDQLWDGLGSAGHVSRYCADHLAVGRRAAA